MAVGMCGSFSGIDAFSLTHFFEVKNLFAANKPQTPTTRAHFSLFVFSFVNLLHIAVN